MKHVASLSEEHRESLQSLMKRSPNHRVRQRAHAILLSARGYSIETLSDIFEAHRNTISDWLDLWQAEGVGALESALEDAPRSGRPRSTTAEQESVLLEAIEENPRDICRALRSVKKKLVSR